MQLKDILTPQSNQALHIAGQAASNRKVKERNDYIMRCLRSSNVKEVMWARKQLGLDKPPVAIAKPAGQKIQETSTYKKLRVE